MDHLHLLASIAGERVAFDATTVESVVEIDVLTPVPRAPVHIAGLAALRSRVLTVIDTHAALGLGTMARRPLMPAIIAMVEGHLYGLLVDRIDDVAALTSAPAPIRGLLAPGWARLGAEGVEHEGRLVLLVDAARLVGDAKALAA